MQPFATAINCTTADRNQLLNLHCGRKTHTCKRLLTYINPQAAEDWNRAPTELVECLLGKKKSQSNNSLAWTWLNMWEFVVTAIQVHSNAETRPTCMYQSPPTAAEESGKITPVGAKNHHISHPNLDQQKYLNAVLQIKCVEKKKLLHCSKYFRQRPRGQQCPSQQGTESIFRL